MARLARGLALLEVRATHRATDLGVLSDLVRDLGFTGIVFPSQAHAGGTNVVVFSERLGDGNSIEVNDPCKQLPKDQSSWQR